VAGREKDMDFLRVLLRERMAKAAVLRARLGVLPVPRDRMELLQERLRRVEQAASIDGRH
jgi:hypothetical protein